MREPLAGQIIRMVKHAVEFYYRLLLVVAPAGAGKTTALRDVRDRTAAPLLNVNLELSRRMLEQTEQPGYQSGDAAGTGHLKVYRGWRCVVDRRF